MYFIYYVIYILLCEGEARVNYRFIEIESE